ncbi:MAG: hypothetical protein ACLSB9_31885 [Hydrogeniiclostridium mannosilyticum]
MGSKGDLQIALRSLRNVRRMARRLQRVPVDCLRINSSDTADAEYVTEWLGIVLCRVCGQPDVSMPPFKAKAPWYNSAGLFKKRPGRPVRSGEPSFWARYPKPCLPRKHGKASTAQKHSSAPSCPRMFTGKGGG